MTIYLFNNLFSGRDVCAKSFLFISTFICFIIVYERRFLEALPFTTCPCNKDQNFKSGVNQITVTANLRWTQNWQFLHPENLSQNARFCTRTFPCDRGYMINTHYVISDVMPRKLLNVGFSDITKFFEVKWSLLKACTTIKCFRLSLY